MKNKFKLFLPLLFFCAYLLHPVESKILAQGEGYSQYSEFLTEQTENYIVNIFISPVRPVVGQQIFSIEVLEKVTNNPVKDLKIEVYATPLFDDKKQFSPALSSSLMEGNYQSILRLEKKGFWLMDFEINNDDEKVTISEQIEIFERNRTIDNSDFSYAFLIIQFIFFGGLIYLFVSSRRRKKKLNI